MPPVSKIHLLPDEVREQLDARLRASNFGDIVAHAEWLRQLGHDVGKSAIGLYSKRDRQRIRAGGRTWSSIKSDFSAKVADQRIECMKLAAALSPNADPERLRAAAEDLLAWAYRG